MLGATSAETLDARDNSMDRRLQRSVAHPSRPRAWTRADRPPGSQAHRNSASDRRQPRTRPL